MDIKKNGTDRSTLDGDDFIEEEGFIDSENEYEENYLLTFVKDAPNLSNFFNSYEWSQDFYKRTIDPLHIPITTCLLRSLGYIEPSNLPKNFGIYEKTGIGLREISLLEEQYNKLNPSFSERPKSKFYLFESPVEAMIQDVCYGLYPEPEILCAVVKAFNLYFAANGDLTLEEVFFGSLVKSAGNYSKRKSKGEGFKEFHYEVMHNSNSDINGEKFSLNKFAETFLNYKFDLGDDFDCCVTSESIESFLKGYHRWKKKNLTNDD